MPVFTISARDYVQLKLGTLQQRLLPCRRSLTTSADDGDSESACFATIDETGIPALQAWCHELTLLLHEKAALTLLTQLQAFVHSFSSFVEGTPGLTEEDAVALADAWESDMSDCPAEDFENRNMRIVKVKRHKIGVTWRLVKV